MSTDAFTEAARAEAETVMSEARERIGITVQEQARYIEGHIAGAEWVRDHLAQQTSITETARLVAEAAALSNKAFTAVGVALAKTMGLEPTSAEVEAAARAIHDRWEGTPTWGFRTEDARDIYREDARAALSAARAALRGDEDA